MTEDLKNDIIQELESWNELKDKVLNVIPIKDISFRTRALLSDILDRLGLSVQDRLDLEKYIIYGGGENIEYIKSIIGNLLTKVPELNYLINNVQTIILLINKLDDLSKKESPFKKGNAENSAVLKGEYQGYSNNAISQTSIAIGAATTAGLKGWYYKDVIGDIVEILTTQPTLQNGRLVGGNPAHEYDVAQAFKVGDVVSFVNYQKYDRYAKVKYVENNRVALTVNFEGNISTEVTINNIDDWSIFLPDKPHLGAVDFGFGAFAEGGISKSTNVCSHAEGFDTEAYGQFSHAEGKETKAAYAAHSEGVKTKAIGNDAHAEGHITIAKGDHSHAEGRETTAIGYASHSEGLYSIAGIGSRPTASTINDAGRYSHAEGNGTQASGNSAHSEGKHTLASGNFSHAEGFNSEAIEQCAHAEGSETHATKLGAHAEGARTKAEGIASHAEGIDCYANGRASHTEGLQTIANNESEHASGKYNTSTPKTVDNTSAEATHFSIGIGSNTSNRKNAFEVKQNGDAYITGIGGFTGANSESSESVQKVINKLEHAIPIDWNAQECESGYIKNKTHYITITNIEETNYTVIKNVPKRYNPDTDCYYLSKEIYIQYNDGDYVGVMKIPINTVLGRKTTQSTMGIAVRDNGEEFIISSYYNGTDILFKVTRADVGTDFKVLIYTPLNNNYLPDTILKTTPQSLSDSDKSQILANLDLDFVKVKYITDPWVIDDTVFDDNGVSGDIVDQNLCDLIYSEPWYAINRFIYSCDGDATYTPCTQVEVYDSDTFILKFNTRSVRLDTNTGQIQIY